MNKGRINYISKFAVLLTFFIFGIVSCSKDEFKPLKKRYVAIIPASNSLGPIASDQAFIGVYNVQFASHPIKDPLEVIYEIKVGDGLLEGRDYEILNKDGGKLVFPPNVYEIPIRIKWLRTAEREDDNDPTSDIISDTLDESKDNTLTITLISNNLNINLDGWSQSIFRGEYQIKKVRAQ